MVLPVSSSSCPVLAVVYPTTTFFHTHPVGTIATGLAASDLPLNALLQFGTGRCPRPNLKGMWTQEGLGGELLGFP